MSGVAEELSASHEELRHGAIICYLGLSQALPDVVQLPEYGLLGSRIRDHGNECIRPRTL
jgi:hypothetical protein